MSTFYDSAVHKVNQARKFIEAGGKRNFQGFCETRNRILQTAKNYEDSGYVGTPTYEPMQSVFRGFSESRSDFSDASNGAGLNGVANTYGIDVVDISILTSVKSFMPYLAVDRGMQKPTDLLTYQKLVAVNSAGGYTAGETVVNPFAPIGTKIALSRTDAKESMTLAATTGTSESVSFPIAKGRTKAKYGDVIGEDIKGDGKIYWQGAGVDVTIDYANGKVSVTDPVGGSGNIELEIYPDRTSEVDGSRTLKLRSETDNIQVTAEPNRVILESSMEQIAYMNRLLGNSMGNSKEFGQIALQQLLNAFVYWINLDLVKTTCSVANEVTPWTGSTIKVFDMTSYYGATGFDKFAGTKNDKLNQFMLEVDGEVLQKSNQGVTYYLTSMQGGNILANNSEKFVKSDLFGQQLNGVIGTFGGVPVLRHDYLTGMDILHNNGTAMIIAGHKDISGAAAPIVYGFI